MLEILLALTLLFVAKKGRRRRFRRYLRGAIDFNFSLVTLAGNTLVSGVVGGSVTEKAWLSSAVIRWSLDDVTPAVDTGPLLVGVAHSDYTDAEIEAWVENTGSWSEGDMVSQEIARRKIRMVGVFQTAPGAASVGIAVLNDGKPIRTKCGWMLESGDTLRVWAYNQGSAAYATTEPNVHVQGHANFWPA